MIAIPQDIDDAEKSAELAAALASGKPVDMKPADLESLSARMRLMAKRLEGQ